MRSSEILWWLREVYIENPEFNKIPIYLDSPMSIKAQSVVDNNREYWGENWLKRDNSLKSLFDWDVIQYISDYKESEAIDVKKSNDYSYFKWNANKWKSFNALRECFETKGLSSRTCRISGKRHVG